MYVGPHVDVSIDQALGQFPLTFERRYDSALAKRDIDVYNSAASTVPNRELGAGWRHNHDIRLVFTEGCTQLAGVDPGGPYVPCMPEHVTLHDGSHATRFERRKGEVAADGEVYEAEPGSPLRLYRTSTGAYGYEWVLTKPNGDRYWFAPRNTQQSSRAHPFPWTEPWRRPEFHQPVTDVYPADVPNIRFRYVYESQDPTEPFYGICQPVNYVSGCDPARGLLVRVVALWKSGASWIQGVTLNLRYSELGGGRGEYYLTTLNEGAAGGGPGPALVKYEIAGTTPVTITAVEDGDACAQNGCTRVAYTYAVYGGYRVLWTVSRPVMNQSGAIVLAKEESFTWSTDAQGKPVVWVHESPGTRLVWQSSGSIASWLRNGVEESVQHDAFGNPILCYNGQCGPPDVAKEYQFSTVNGAVSLGVRREMRTDGLWVLRSFDERGLLLLELIVDYAGSETGKPDFDETTEPGGTMPFVRVDVTGTNARILAATRYYYTPEGRTWVIARFAEHQQASWDGKVRFPAGPDLESCYGVVTSWFVCGGPAFNDVNDGRLQPWHDLGTSATRHYYEVTVLDADSDGDDIINETRTRFPLPGGVNDQTDTLLARVERAGVKPDLEWYRSTTNYFQDAAATGRYASIVKQNPTATGTQSETTFTYFPVDAATSTALLGRRREIATAVTWPSSTQTTWEACDTGAYDYRGRLLCYHPYPDSQGAQLIVLWDDSYYNGTPGRWLEFTTTAAGSSTRQTITERTSGGFVVQTKTTEGNGQAYRAQAGTSATTATLVAKSSRRGSTGSTLAEDLYLYSSSNGRITQSSTNAAGSVTRRRTRYAGYDPLHADPLVTRIEADVTTLGAGTDDVVTTFSYDEVGRVTSSTEADGTWVEYSYGPPGSGGDTGKVTQVWRAGSVVQEYGYTDAGRLEWVWAATAGAGSPVQATYQYDSSGRVVVEDMPATGRRVEYDYDGWGRLVGKRVSSLVDGAVISDLAYVYDDADRLVTICDGACPTSTPAVGEVRYVYDDKGGYPALTTKLTNNYQLGKLAYYEDESGATFFEYNAFGDVIAVVRHEGALAGWDPGRLVETKYTYGPAGELVTTQYPSTRLVTYGYGSDKQLPTSVTYTNVPGGGGVYPVLTTATYDVDGSPTGWLWGGEANSPMAIAYDYLGRATSISTVNGGVTGTNVSYLTSGASPVPAYDGDGDVTREAATEPDNWLFDATGANANTFTYHTSRDMLKSWTNVTGVVHSLDFDSGGRRKYHWMNSTSYLYSWMSARPDRLYYRNRGGVNSADVVLRYVVDGNGNGSRGDGFPTDYDGAGLVTALDWGWDGYEDFILDYGPHGNVRRATTLQSGTWTYQYDAEMRRVKKSGSLGGDHTRFRYGLGRNVLEEYRSEFQRTETDEYIYLGGRVVGVVHAGSGPGGTAPVDLLYVETDRMGVARKVRSRDGSLVARLPMDPWGGGSPRSSLPDEWVPAMRQRHAGQYSDWESGLLENGYRSMESATGVYTSPDPLHRWSSLIDVGPQAYSYAAGQPLFYQDPLGLSTWLCSKPLDALGGRDAAPEETKSWGEASWNPLYHQYYCVIRIEDGKTVTRCYGLTSANGGPNEPGKPSTDMFVKERCKKIQDDQECLEQCLIKTGKNPSRPHYRLTD